jgi:hypothetical protein
MTVVRPPERSDQPSDANAAVPPRPPVEEKSRRVFVSAAIGSCIGRIVGDGGYRRPQGMAPEDLGLARVTSRGRYRGGSGGRLHRVRRPGRDGGFDTFVRQPDSPARPQR